VPVNRLLEMLAAGAKGRRRVERHVDPTHRSQWQAIESDVDDWFHGR
jgi:hypothetical protein